MTKEWPKYRDLILAYYQMDGLPLTRVMEIMKTKHKFNASQRAYRQQFQKWKIFKYNRKSRDQCSSHSCMRHHDHGNPDHHAYPEPYLTSKRFPHVLPLPVPTTTKHGNYAYSCPLNHCSTQYELQSPLPSTGRLVPNIYSTYAHSPDTKPVCMASSPDHNDALYNLDRKPYIEAGSPYESHSQAQHQSHSHSNEPYSHHSYYGSPSAPLEASSYTPDSLPRIQTHAMNRYASHSQNSFAGSSSSGNDSPYSYSPGASASSTPNTNISFISQGSHTAALPRQAHTLSTQYQPPMYPSPSSV